VIKGRSLLPRLQQVQPLGRLLGRGVLSQASCCASAAFQLLGSRAGKRAEKLGALCAATWKYCKSQPPFVKPSVPLNIVVEVLCAYVLWL